MASPFKVRVRVRIRARIRIRVRARARIRIRVRIGGTYGTLSLFFPPFSFCTLHKHFLINGAPSHPLPTGTLKQSYATALQHCTEIAA